MDGGSTDPEACFRLGTLLWRKRGDRRASLPYLRKATQLSPRNAAYRRELADLYETLGFAVHAQKQRELLRRHEGVSPPPRSGWFGRRSAR